MNERYLSKFGLLTVLLFFGPETYGQDAHYETTRIYNGRLAAEATVQKVSKLEVLACLPLCPVLVIGSMVNSIAGAAQSAPFALLFPGSVEPMPGISFPDKEAFKKDKKLKWSPQIEVRVTPIDLNRLAILLRFVPSKSDTWTSNAISTEATLIEGQELHYSFKTGENEGMALEFQDHQVKLNGNLLVRYARGHKTKVIDFSANALLYQFEPGMRNENM